MKHTVDDSIEDTDGQFLPSPKLRSKNNPRSITLSKNRKMAKPSPRTSFQPVDDKQTTNIVKFGNRNYKKVEMIPRNIAQETYVEALLEKRMVFAVGPAGTGKTLLAVLRAIKALRENEIVDDDYNVVDYVEDTARAVLSQTDKVKVATNIHQAAAQCIWHILSPAYRRNAFSLPCSATL